MRRSIPKIFAAYVVAMLLAACESDSPFLTKEEANRIADEINTSRDPFHGVKNVVAIINNDIYYFDRLDSVPRKLTDTYDLKKTNVKLSSDRNKIAYLNHNGNPVIISAVNGQVLETLTQYKYIKQIGWVRNSPTLFMLIDKTVTLHGASLNVIQPSSYGTGDVLSFSMNSLGDQGVLIWGFNGMRLHYRSHAQNIDESFSGFQGDYYLFNYVDFYDSQGGFLIGEKDTYTKAISRIACFQEYNFYPAYEWGSDLMWTPEFNAEKEILLFGTAGGGTSFLKGVYLGTEAYPQTGSSDILTRTLADYPSTTPVHVDWMQ